MSNKKDCIRIVLEGEAKASHDEMLAELQKNSSISINSSKLASWIFCRFLQKSFTKDKDQMIEAHFNSKKYLREAMSKAENPADLKDALRRALMAIDKNDKAEPKKATITNSNSDKNT